MKSHIALLFVSLIIFSVQAQINPDDELIPVLGGRNDNPVAHPVIEPQSRNRVVFEKDTRHDTKLTRVRQRKLAEERQKALNQLKTEVALKPELNLITCLQCFGTGLNACTYCQGAGFNECDVCHGIKDKVCTRCRGSAFVYGQPCTSCEGTGLSVCKSCSGKKKSCLYCSGVGHNNCLQCNGAGKLISTGDSIVHR